MTVPLDDDDWGRTVDASGDFARVEQLQNHLLIIFPVGYIAHSPTRFTVPGKKSDVIVCDIIDLDAPDDQGGVGKIYRTAWLRQAQIIMSLRPFVGRRVLGQIGKGISRNGMNPPWVVHDMVGEATALDKANAWLQSNRDFVVSTFQAPVQLSQPEPYQQQPQAPRFQQPAPQVYQQPYGGGSVTTPPPPQQYTFNAPPPPAQPAFQAPAPQYMQQQPQPQYQQAAPPPPQFQAAAPQYQQPAPQQYPPQGAPPSFPVQQQQYQAVDDSMLSVMRAEQQRRMTNDSPGDPPF